jgi:hypothetical protein
VSFGGISNRSAISDVRVLANDVWTTLGHYSDMPAAETGFVYDSRRDRFIAFGGTVGDGSACGDTWEFDGRRWSAREFAKDLVNGRALARRMTRNAASPSSSAAPAAAVSSAICGLDRDGVAETG